MESIFLGELGYFKTDSCATQTQSAIFLNPGTSFVHVSAIDLDDPSTPNANLQYKILTQTPRQPSENMFEINSRTGAVFLSAEGKVQLWSFALFVLKYLNNYGFESLNWQKLVT